MYKLLINLSLLILLATTGCFDRQKKDQNNVRTYHETEFGLHFDYLKNWKLLKVSYQPHFTVKFELPAEMDYAELYVLADQSKDFIFSDLQENYLSFIQYLLTIHPEFTLLSSKPYQGKPADGIVFSAYYKEREKYAEFYYTTLYNISYVVAIEYDDLATKEKQEHLFHQFLNDIQLSAENPLSSNTIEQLFKVKAFTKPNQINNAMVYGQHLLEMRHFDANNYHLALEQFRRILVTTYDKRTNSVPYEQALALLNLTHTLREQQYLDHQFDIKRSTALHDWNTAKHNLKLIMAMYPETSWKYKEAQQEYIRYQ